MRRIAWILVLLIVISGGAYFWLRPDPASLEQVTGPLCATVQPQRGTITESVIGRGKLAARRLTYVPLPEMGRRITRILVRENEQVAAETCLAVVESDPQFLMELSNTKGEIARNDQFLQELEKKLQREKGLLGEGFIAADGVKQTETQLNNARLQRDLLAERLQLLQKSIGDDGSYCVRAPFAGTVLRLNKKEGDLVHMMEQRDGMMNNSSLLVLADMSVLEVDYQLSEIYLESVGAGDTVELVFDAFPRQSYRGQVEKISPVAVIPPGEQNGFKELSYYPVTIQVLDPDTKLMPGLSCKISITVQHVDNGLLAPISALLKDDGHDYVYVAHGTEISRRQVTVGLVNEEKFEVRSGLTENDEICQDPFVVAERQALLEQRREKSWLERLFQ